MKETTFIFCLAISLLASSVIAGDSVDYLSSEETFLEAYPEAVEIQPSVFQVTIDKSRTRTYTFGREGMQYELERMRELVLKERQANQDLSRSELEDAYWTLSEFYSRGAEAPGIRAQETGTLCTGMPYDLDAVATNAGFFDAGALASAGFEQLPYGPPYAGGPATLYAHALADNGTTTITDGGTAGPFDINGQNGFISTDAYAETADYQPLTCLYSRGAAWIFVEYCPWPDSTFRSVSEVFEHPSGCY